MTHQVRLFCFSPEYIAYDEAWAWQHATAASLHSGVGAEAIALLQHEPVFTFGRRIRPEHLLHTRVELKARGAAIVESDRGGDVTFHGPGQAVAYPILNLRKRSLGPIDYVRRLEATVIVTLCGFGIAGERVQGRPGVWVDGAKVAAVGVRVQDGVTTHGFALNVDTDLSWYNAIVPCGIAGAPVTSMARILGASPGMEAVEGAICEAFENVFDSELVPAAGPGRGRSRAIPAGVHASLSLVKEPVFNRGR